MKVKSGKEIIGTYTEITEGTEFTERKEVDSRQLKVEEVGERRSLFPQGKLNGPALNKPRVGYPR